jgi:hypothetical protein
MIKTKIEKRKVEVTKDIACNSCGQSCKAVSGQSFSYALLSAHWGYSSNRDGEIHTAHLCEACWEKIIKWFKISDLVADNQY